MGLINQSQENTRYHSACSCAYSDSLPQKQSTRIETKMSGTTNALALTPSDASKILAAKMHYGGLNCKFQMKTYVYDRTSAGEHIIDIAKMWEKVVLAARIMVTCKPQDICVVSSSVIGQRASSSSSPTSSNKMVSVLKRK